jgi:hypothetical protein
MLWDNPGRKQIKEAETEARLKALEDKNEQRRLKEVGGLDFHSFSFWAGAGYRSIASLYLGHSALGDKVLYIKPRHGTCDYISEDAAKRLRDMLLREFPVETQAQPAPAKKAGRK